MAEPALRFRVGGRPARGAPGKRLYVVGDVHGRADLLQRLAAAIVADHEARGPRDAFLVLVGDLIDRGPQSREVVELVRTGALAPFPTLSLAGNHEEALVEGLRGRPERLGDWLAHGGYDCARSYGAPIGALFGAQPAVIERILCDHIPLAHLEFLAGLPDTVQFGDFLLAHAGVDPGAPLAAQGRAVRWIREPFLSSDKDFGAVVVHGHTVRAEVEVRSNRIGLDTGAYESGRLSGACIEDDAVTLLSVQGPTGPAHRRGA